MPSKKFLPYIYLILTILLGGVLRFYKLDWGEGYFFHPDEYHIAGAVNRLINSGITTNPKLFSYGSFGVYLIYIIFKTFSLFTKSLNIFIVGRTLSAFFSTLTLINIYLIAKILFTKNKYFPIVLTLTAAFIPGLIQQAHFLTPESFMTFWITLSAYFLLKYQLKSSKFLNLILSAMSLGFAGGVKISSFAVLPFVVMFLFLSKLKRKKILSNFFNTVFYIVVSFFSFAAVFPYSIIDLKNFMQTSVYESSLSMGKVMVFYTRSFTDSIPIIFQILRIFPYTLGVVLTIFSLFGIVATFYRFFKNKNKQRGILIILLGYLFSFFIFNSILFTKWTRFMHPTIPFFIIIAFLGIAELSDLFRNDKFKKISLIFLSAILIIPTVIWGLMFFSIYIKSDVRITASEWVLKNIPQNTLILTETGNTLEVPLKGSFAIIPFDFYNLDNNTIIFNKLLSDLASSDYFIIQSRRIYMNHNKDQFPNVYNFYDALFSGKLGFREIKSFSSFPKLEVDGLKLETDDEKAEETWSVFDHPVIRIFEKTKSYPLNYYEQLLRR